MNPGNEKRRIYIVVSQTGTILSRILKLITGAEYNHASISLDSKLERMYSFGRKHPYNPFRGGFVTESPETGTFKRFRNTKAVILAIDVDGDTYERLSAFLEEMYERRREYHYNYLGLMLAAFRLCYRHRNSYYYSEFVKEMLLKFDIVGVSEFENIVKPIHFLDLPHVSEIYRGRLVKYRV